MGESGGEKNLISSPSSLFPYYAHPKLTRCGHLALPASTSPAPPPPPAPSSIALSTASLPTTLRFSILKLRNWSTDLSVPVMATSFLSSIVMG